jgi:hypothetical protein
MSDDCAAPDQVTLTLIMRVVYDPQGMTADELESLLDTNFRHAIGNGMLTGDTPAEVEALSVRTLTAAPDLLDLSDVLDVLVALTDWAREHTSPRDPNSPHNILVDAMKVIAKATNK